MKLFSSLIAHRASFRGFSLGHKSIADLLILLLISPMLEPTHPSVLSLKALPSSSPSSCKCTRAHGSTLVARQIIRGWPHACVPVQWLCCICVSKAKGRQTGRQAGGIIYIRDSCLLPLDPLSLSSWWWLETKMCWAKNNNIWVITVGFSQKFESSSLGPCQAALHLTTLSEPANCRTPSFWWKLSTMWEGVLVWAHTLAHRMYLVANSLGAFEIGLIQLNSWVHISTHN